MRNLNEMVRKIQASPHRDTAMVAAGYLILLLSAIASYHRKDGTWFARSGSIATLLGAFVQFRLGNSILGKHTDAIMISSFAGIPAAPNITKLTVSLSKYAVVLICIAAVIWGYGDLLFPTPMACGCATN